MIVHVVLFQPKPTSAPAEWARLRGELASLQGRIPGITRFIWGPNTSPEGLGQEYEHGFVMEFVDRAAQDGYLSHPAHEAVHPIIDTLAERVLVYDIEA